MCYVKSVLLCGGFKKVNFMNLEELKGLIPNSGNWIKFSEITFGWSGEQKYRICTLEQGELLLRLLTQEQFDSQEDGIEFLRKLNSVTPFVPKVLDSGETRDGTWKYILLEYIAGEDGMTAIHNYSPEEQYKLGYSMGKIIDKIHKFSTPKLIPQKTQELKNKSTKYLEYYLENKDKYPFLNGVTEKVSELFKQIDDRPLVMLHNDFHLGNMVINKDKIYLIDFNRATLGDSVREFDCIAWSATHSTHFACGLLDAYLSDKDKEEFFALLRGYISLWQIQMLYFIKDETEEENRVVLDLIKFSATWFDGTSNIPNWYK